jgi:F-type H+-transporting ATPase subunit b
MAEAAPHGADAGAHGAAHGAAEAGFPPFDISLFPHQLIWFAVTFGILYFLMSRVALPAVAKVLEARKHVIQTDLDAAAMTSEAAEIAKAEAERATAEARAGARKLVDDMRAGINASLADDRAKAEAVLADRVAAAETRIAAARTEALASVDGIAADLSKEVVAKLTGAVA